MSKWKRSRTKISIIVLVIAIVITASIGYAYFRSVNTGEPRPTSPGYYNLNFYMVAPFINPRNGTENGGGWEEELFYNPGCIECDTSKFIARTVPILDAGFSFENNGTTKPLKSIGETPSVLWTGSNFTFYAFAVQNKTMRFIHLGGVVPLDNATPEITEKEMYTIENARLAILDRNNNDILDKGDRVVIFNDYITNMTGKIPYYSGFTLFSKDGTLGGGGFELESESGWKWEFYDFSHQKFDNNLSIDHRRSSGWILNWTETKVRNPSADIEPALDYLSFILLGYSYDGYYHIQRSISINDAEVSCLNGPRHYFVFKFPLQDGMHFEDNGTEKPLDSTTVCRLTEDNLKTVTGASLIYIDSPKLGNWTSGDEIWIYRAFDQNSNDSIIWYNFFVNDVSLQLY